jgi:hypothetical protein
VSPTLLEDLLALLGGTLVASAGWHGGTALVVAHRFDGESSTLKAILLGRRWSLNPESGEIEFTSPAPYSGHVFLLELKRHGTVTGRHQIRLSPK